MNAKKTGVALFFILVALFATLTVGCKKAAGPAGQKADEGQEGTQLKAFYYDCKDGKSVVTAYNDDDTMTLFAPGKTMKLKHLISGSGARYGYEDESVIFWSKGDDALYERDGRKTECSVNRLKSIIESVKLDGYDFYAVGNEPGWNLKIGMGKIVFAIDYGNHRFTFKAPKPDERKAQRMTTYRASEGDHRIDVVLRGVECADSMSGEKFETTVLVVFDGKPLPGCGQALH
jgi:membrane-bound inhibitor of C-type lysozyme